MTSRLLPTMRAFVFWDKHFFSLLIIFFHKGLFLAMMSSGKRARTVGPSALGKRRARDFAVAIRNANKRFDSVGRAQQVLQRARRRRNAVVGGFVGTELKYFDTLKAETTVTGPSDTTSFLFNPATGGDCLNCPAQGSSALQRDGKKIRMKSLYIRGWVRRPALEAFADTYPPIQVYLAAVLDRQTNGAAAASNIIWKQAPGGMTTLYNASLFRDLENGERFKILRDQLFDLNVLTLTSAGANSHSSAGLVRHFTWFIPLNGLPVYFTTATTAVIANIVRNSVSMYAVASVAPTGNNDSVACGYQSRLRFFG